MSQKKMIKLSMITAYFIFDLKPQTFLNLTLADASDLGTGLMRFRGFRAPSPRQGGRVAETNLRTRDISDRRQNRRTTACR